MSKIYKGPTGMVPNVGVFAEGDELTDEQAARLVAAGYEVEDTKDDISEEGGEA